MITDQEIKRRATITSLHPHIIEKNYVLSWLLDGIFRHNALRNAWIFKGGTCIKKCYFETYRFSEDLDFTLTNTNHLKIDFLNSVFIDICIWIEKKTGITFPKQADFEVHPNNPLSCTGKITYLGPVSPRNSSVGLPTIKLDLTADEFIVLPPIQKQVFHPYTDCPKNGIHIMSNNHCCYTGGSSIASAYVSSSA